MQVKPPEEYFSKFYLVICILYFIFIVPTSTLANLKVFMYFEAMMRELKIK